MGISFGSALGIHEQALGVRTKRAEVLANNLANAETPHFKAQDVDFQSALKMELQKTGDGGLDMNTSRFGHITGGAEMSNDESLLFRIPQQASIDGNTVEEHIEHGEYMKNAMDFQASFQFLNGKFKGLMSAIKGE
ncbi:MAG: flagellar basal body rod protein FlgB [Cellvibrionaceae bacterium]